MLSVEAKTNAQENIKQVTLPFRILKTKTEVDNVFSDFNEKVNYVFVLQVYTDDKNFEKNIAFILKNKLDNLCYVATETLLSDYMKYVVSDTHKKSFWSRVKAFFV